MSPAPGGASAMILPDLSKFTTIFWLYLVLFLWCSPVKPAAGTSVSGAAPCHRKWPPGRRTDPPPGFGSSLQRTTANVRKDDRAPNILVDQCARVFR